jgi:hypothetical protein
MARKNEFQEYISISSFFSVIRFFVKFVYLYD